MASESFCHLHVHSQYSLLDGACRISETARAAEEMGMPAIAITDHGNLFGAVEFYSTLKERGLKPIIGYEAYFTPESRQKKAYTGGRQELYHVTLLARNQKGYENLVKLSSFAFLEGFYYKPRVDWELLEDCCEGLICLSGCLQSRSNQLLLAGDADGAERWLADLRDLFGKDCFFVELQDHGLEDQRRVLPEGVRLAGRLQVPLVATNDCHYLKAEDRSWHDVLLCINTGKNLSDENRFRMESDQLYFKSPEQMAELFSNEPEAIANTLRISEMCELELDTTRKYPTFKSEEEPAKDNAALLREKARESLEQSYGELAPEVAERLNYELKVIEEMGYVDYFLIVWDFVRFAREKDIPVGMRGSGGGSLVAHALGLTDVDPVRHDLIFNRFLDPERREPPDIDIDLCENRREEVIDYVRQRYGSQSTAQIITFGTLQARNCVRDVGRVLGVDPKKVDTLAKMIPQSPGTTLESALRDVAELRQRAQEDEETQRILEYARNIEGLPRHVSTHAAGVVIADRPLWQLVPLYRDGDGGIMTQWAMNDLDQMGLLKMDFLGLRTLTTIHRTLQLIAERGEQPPSLDAREMNLEDVKTYELLCEGHTKGVFQFGSDGMQQLLKRVRPSNIEDVIAVVGLYRPGPLQSGMVDDFVDRKRGDKPIEYSYPTFEPILKSTYGVIVYQEQIMRIVNSIAGISMADALTLQKAISKKKQEVIEKQHQAFVEGAIKHGLERETAEGIFGLILHFAGYGFNKAHASAYAFLAYRTAFLKAHYPTEFMAASISCEMGDRDKVVELMDDCARMGIEVLPPDINDSGGDFKVVGELRIRFGLGAIRNVGTKPVSGIIAEREENGPYQNLFDFCERVDQQEVTRATVEGLMKAGCFDELPGSRAQQLAILETAMTAGARARKNRIMGQASLFGATVEEDPGKRMAANLPDVPPLGIRELARQESEALGHYVRYDPLEEYRHRLGRLCSAFSDQLGSLEENTPVVMGGIVESVQKRLTRDQRPMAVLKLLDLKGTVQSVIFPEAYEKYAEILESGEILCLCGTVSHRRGTALQVEEVMSLDQAQEKLTSAVVISVSCADAYETLWEDLKRLLEASRGPVPVFLELRSGRLALRSRVSSAGGALPSDRFAREVEDMLGKGTVRFAVERNGRGNRRSRAVGYGRR